MSELLSMPNRAELAVSSERLLLRPLTKADAGVHYVAWLNDPETMRYMAYPCGRATVSEVEGYIAQFATAEDALLLGVFLQESGQHIGNAKLEPIDWRHQNAFVGVLIGEPAARGQGLGREAMRLCVELAFTALRLHRVALGVTADNQAAIRCYESLGFVREGVQRQATRRGADWVDNLEYGLLAAAWDGGVQ